MTAEEALDEIEHVLSKASKYGYPMCSNEINTIRAELEDAEELKEIVRESVESWMELGSGAIIGKEDRNRLLSSVLDEDPE